MIFSCFWVVVNPMLGALRFPGRPLAGLRALFFNFGWIPVPLLFGEPILPVCSATLLVSMVGSLAVFIPVWSLRFLRAGTSARNAIAACILLSVFALAFFVELGRSFFSAYPLPPFPLAFFSLGALTGNLGSVAWHTRTFLADLEREDDPGWDNDIGAPSFWIILTLPVVGILAALVVLFGRS